MADKTLLLNKNVVSRKKLVGIANFIAQNSEARYASQGSQILSTEQEIRDTKKAQVLIPLLTDIQNVSEILSQAKAGGISLTEADLNEFIVNLANEMITKPLIYRPRDGEVISADALMDRYTGSFQISALAFKDRQYWKTIKKNGVDGVDVATGIAGATKKLKSKVVSSALTKTEIKDKAFEAANLVRKELVELYTIRTRLIQQRFVPSDLLIVTRATFNINLQNDARYNMYAETPIGANGILNGKFDGVDVIVSKQLPDDVDFIIKVKGSASSLFSIRNVLNVDKVVGVQAYALSLEFDEGTGTFLPQLITIGSSTIKAQPRITFDDLVLAGTEAITTSGNK